MKTVTLAIAVALALSITNVYGDLIECGAGEQFCCASSKSNDDASYSLSEMVGCQSSGATCEGYASISGNQIDCLCGNSANPSTDLMYLNEWILDCDTDQCLKDRSCYLSFDNACNNKHVDISPSLCNLGDAIQDALGAATKTFGTWLIIVIAVVVAIVGLIIYFCCCRKPQTVVIQQGAQ